jgi:hypothetical protein
MPILIRLKVVGDNDMTNLKRITALAAQIYDEIGYDAFGGECSDVEEFVSVMRDQVRFRLESGDVDDADRLLSVWETLTYAEKFAALSAAM